jgi:hypothetical protein
MADLEQELLNALQAVSAPAVKQDCGCRGKMVADDTSADPFALATPSTLADAGAALNAALAALQSDTDLEFASLENLLSEDDLAFADLEQSSSFRVEDVLTLVEKYPGLKITFSY